MMGVVVVAICVLFVNYAESFSNETNSPTIFYSESFYNETNSEKTNGTRSFYNETTAKKVFEKFKKRYKKNYANEEIEKIAFMNFLYNLNEVSDLNNRSNEQYHLTGVRDYNLNRYADKDPADVLERYGVTMKPYYYVKNDKHHGDLHEWDLKQKNFEDLLLYDLEHTEDLYKYFLAYFKKKVRGFKNRQISYYRFYKTLIELNNKRFNGENVIIEADADIVKHSREYYFDE